LDIEAKIEKLRSILNNAIETNENHNTILEISQKLDEYIVEYLNNRRYKGHSHSATVQD